MEPNMPVIDKNFIGAFTNGYNAMVAEASIPEASWYPCGFAYLCIKVRKNSKLAHPLLQCGFRWNDYNKEYRYGMPHELKLQGMTQSMDYAERCLNAIVKKLEPLELTCYVHTHID